jgi:calcium-dependent protein kinase
VILFILLCGYVPFGGQSDEQIFQNIKTAELEFFSPAWDNISELVKDLIRNMLNRDTTARFSMD